MLEQQFVVVVEVKQQVVWLLFGGVGSKQPVTLEQMSQSFALQFVVSLWGVPQCCEEVCEDCSCKHLGFHVDCVVVVCTFSLMEVVHYQLAEPQSLNNLCQHG